MNGDWKAKKSHSFDLFNTTIFYEQNVSVAEENIPHYYPFNNSYIIEKYNEENVNELLYIMGPISQSLIVMV